MDKQNNFGAIIADLRQYIQNEMHETRLQGYAARDASLVLLQNWESALNDGNTDNLVADVDEVVARLREFQSRARLVLPEANGGAARSNEYVIYSPSEAANADGAGYWNNKDGWTVLDGATKFSAEEIKEPNLPLSAGQDARVGLFDSFTGNTARSPHVVERSEEKAYLVEVADRIFQPFVAKGANAAADQAIAAGYSPISVTPVRVSGMLKVWLSRVDAAMAAMQGVEVEFVTTLQERCEENRIYHDHDNQRVAQFLRPELAPRNDFDEEALPYFRVRFADGAEMLADDAELFSDDPRYLELLASVVGAFSVARGMGFVGPWHLDEEGTDAQRNEFIQQYRDFKIDEAPDYWQQLPNAPERFRADERLQEILSCEQENSALILDLVRGANERDIDLTDCLDDIMADMKDFLGANAANRCSNEDDQEDAIAIAEQWVTDNVSNAPLERRIAGAMWLMGADVATERIRNEIRPAAPAPKG